MKTAARILNALGLFIVILVLLLYLLIFLPQLTKLQTHEITSGSMEPAIETGSLTFTREVSFEEIRPGDVIVFRVDGSEGTVTHRVTAVNAELRELTTRGDANEIEDLRPVSADHVEGKVIFSVPLLGFIEGFFTTPEGKASSGSLLLGAIILRVLGGRIETGYKKKYIQPKEDTPVSTKSYKRSTPLLDAMLLLFICGALFALYKIVSPMVKHRISEAEYESLEEYVSMPCNTITAVEILEDSETADANAVLPLPEASPEDAEEDEPYFPWTVEWPEADFEALREINPDVVGWLYVEGTQINYPVVQGEDNEYYLNRSFKGTKSSIGCLYLDYRNSTDFNDLHANIYGHHINNGSMMAAIVKYKNQSFFDNHPYGLLVTPDANFLIEFYSGFISEAYDDAWQVQFSSYSEYEDWLDRGTARSLFISDIRPGRDDRILSLSTCTYEFNDARFVLNGILHKEPKN